MIVDINGKNVEVRLTEFETLDLINKLQYNLCNLQENSTIELSIRMKTTIGSLKCIIVPTGE